MIAALLQRLAFGDVWREMRKIQETTQSRKKPRSRIGGLRSLCHVASRPESLLGKRDRQVYFTTMELAFRLVCMCLETDCLLGLWYFVFFSEKKEILPPTDSHPATRHFVSHGLHPVV